MEDAEVDPFEAEEIERILTLALRKRNGVRFVIALALGLRQGEALGLSTAALIRMLAAPATTRSSRARRIAGGTSENAHRPVSLTAPAMPAGAISATVAA